MLVLASGVVEAQHRKGSRPAGEGLAAASSHARTLCSVGFMMESAKLPALGYVSVLESLAEKFHSSQVLLRQLNPGASWTAGEDIRVPDVEPFAVPSAAPAAAGAPAPRSTSGPEPGVFWDAKPSQLKAKIAPSPNNWDAARLGRLVSAGTRVTIQ